MTISDKIRELRELADRATPGPWHTLGQPFCHSENADKAVLAGHWDPSKAGRVVAECDLTMEWIEGEPDGSIEDVTNARFIAASRTAVPALCSALERAVEALEAIGDMALAEAANEEEWMHEATAKSAIADVEARLASLLEGEARDE